MSLKLRVAGSFVAVLLFSCVSPVGSNSTISPPFTATVASTYSLTNTSNNSLAQATETKMAQLLAPYQMLQSNDLTALHWTLGEEVIKTLWFTQSAKWWSDQDKQTAQEVLTLGMNPGLGVCDLHAHGITGQGITVAIIDQPVLLEHPEFKGKIIKYRDFGTGAEADKGSMHGPAVTSLLAGENIGTAPGVGIYYAAVPSWYYDAQYYADALNWLVAENEALPENKKIRVVSVSSIPSGLWSEYKNQDAWNIAYDRALQADLLVLDGTYEHGYTNPCTLDMRDVDNVTKCIPQWNGPTDSPQQRIYVPMSQRSMAIENDRPVFSYQYVGQGGISWTIPYLAGVLALGWQVNPALTDSQLFNLVYASAYTTDDHHTVINPTAFIEMIRRTLTQ